MNDACDDTCACSVFSTGYCACDDFRDHTPDDPTPAALAVLGLDDGRLRWVRWMVETGRLSDQIAPETHVAPHQAPQSLSVGMVCLTAALVALWLVVVLEMPS